VVVLLRKNLLVLDRLDFSVVMVLVNLLVNSSGDLFVAVRADMLFSHGVVGIFMDGCLVMSILGHKSFNGLLCFVHSYWFR